ncbi:rhamnan synthesis F family protein [Lichenicola sp.]|uniref:rhamnan synthesis F family protein n=1 Tax=Lichenicola sp. TaxID=2804529 RepID=UPI003B003F32
MSDEEREAGQAAARDRQAAIAARRALLERSGYFDPDWYCRTVPAAALSDLPPLDHYLSHGVAALASPGPLFDAAAYLRHAWHLRPGLDDPLTHYLEQGLGEGRQAVSCTDPASWNPLRLPVEPLLSRAAPSRPVRVCVVVHAFHVELFDEICQSLRMLPERFTLLVTTDEPEKADIIRESFARSGLDAYLLVQVAANRGRNFGPFLTHLGNAILDHEMVLHLHTKTSQYRGAEQVSWRHALLRTLLPARPVVSGIIERFVADPTLGVITACPGEEMRYWGYDWLSNRHLAQPLFDRLGVEAAVPRGMFDYPLGGMFWARSSALSKLLGHDWTPQDFPPELGQTDGTIMHAIERSIVLIAADAGYGFAELDYRRGLFRPGWSSRNLDQYARTSHDGLLDTIAQVDTVSFDIFDTLLTRICLVPDAVHRFIGFVAARRFPGADQFAERRRAAEDAARRETGSGDVDLDEIHARFRRDAGPGWSEAAIAFVQHEELALDARLLTPRDIMLAALRHAVEAGRRVILVSDSYLPRRVLDDMLARFGIGALADTVYLSSERRARKDRGDLWQLVADAEPGARTGRLLHVGDNAQSDIQQTADAGIRHFHVLSPAALMDMHGLATPAGPDGGRPLGDDILLGPLAARLFNTPYLEPGPGAAPLLDEPELAGAVLFGPLMVAFIGWLARHPTTRHLDRMLFVSREGYFLKRLYDAMRAASGRDDLPPSLYFHCSRRAALAAAQGVAFDPEPVLQGSGFNGSLAEFLLARLGFVSDAVSGDVDTMISLPRDTDLVRCMMQLLEEPIAAHGRRALQAFTAYATVNGMAPAEKPGFVDVGYSGTMQRAIQTALGRPLIGLYAGVSAAAQQVRLQGGHAFGAFAQGDVASFTGGYGLMLEAFLTAPHGQVIGYDDSRSPPVPSFRTGGASQLQFAMLERLYQGVEDYALALVRDYGPDLLDLPFSREAATTTLAAVRDGRLRLSPEMMSILAVEDDFCGNGEIPVFSQLATPASRRR